MSMSYRKEKLVLKTPFPKPSTFTKSVQLLSRSHEPNSTQNQRVYAVCSELEVVGDVMQRLKGSYLAVNFKLLAQTFSTIKKNQFVMA